MIVLTGILKLSILTMFLGVLIVLIGAPFYYIPRIASRKFAQNIGGIGFLVFVIGVFGAIIFGFITLILFIIQPPH